MYSYVGYDDAPSDVSSRISAHERGATCLAFNKGFHQCASGGADGMVKLWDVDSAQEIKVNKVLKSPPTCISFCENGQMYAVAASGKMDNYAIRI